MTRKVVIAVCLCLVGLGSYAQERMPGRENTYTDEENGNGFLKQNLFMGGSLGLAFSTDQFSIGLNPEIGYSLNRWLDAGVVVNFNYNSISQDPSLGFYYGEKQFIYGGGAFARVFFLPFLFVTVQPEYNWISDKQTQNGASYQFNASAASLLVGGGYGQRLVGRGTYYIAILFDVAGDRNSPYNDVYGHPLPILRAGFDVFVHHH